MKIATVSMNVLNLEKMTDFYSKYFGAKVDDKYENFRTGYTYCFLSFEDGARLLLVSGSNIDAAEKKDNVAGFSRLSFAVDSAEKVQELATQIARDGLQVVSGFRMNGYGEYESRVLDPEGNEIEIATVGNDGK